MTYTLRIQGRVDGPTADAFLNFMRLHDIPTESDTLRVILWSFFDLTPENGTTGDTSEPGARE